MRRSTKLNYSVDKYKVIRPLYTSPTPPPRFDVFASIFAPIFPFYERHTSFCLVPFERAKDKETRNKLFSNSVEFFSTLLSFFQFYS